MFSSDIKAEYQPLAVEPSSTSNNSSFDGSPPLLPVEKGEEPLNNAPKRSRFHRTKVILCIFFTFMFLVGINAEILFIRELLKSYSVSSTGKINGIAARIPLSTIHREFTYSSPFSQPPPVGDDADTMSEPIWDSLIPNGLGYFKDDSVSPTTFMPTVFHQLHCLYTIRRAYYSRTDEPQHFSDFGKTRTMQVAHCFDYLQQSLTCSADSTVEPAIDDEKKNGFLGTGFQRRCRDFEALKMFVEEKRVFNATGFLAHVVG